MVIIIDESNFKEEVLDSDLVLIDFYASWCGPCQMMGSVFERVSKNFKNLKFVKINTDENPDLASKYNVSGIPCLILTKKGKEVDRIIGYVSESVLTEKINFILKKI